MNQPHTAVAIIRQSRNFLYNVALDNVENSRVVWITLSKIKL